MPKPNAFVKISGNLLENAAVLEWLRELAKIYFVAICIGGGEQINEAFEKQGFPIEFGLLGRETSSLEGRQLARDVLERNQASIQDQLDDVGVNARVIIPVTDIGSVLCHINGDVLFLAAYIGFDKLFMLTTEDKVKAKKLWLEQIIAALKVNNKGELNKIEVVGF